MRWFELYIALAWILRFAMVPVILRRQLAPGASIAWLGIIFLHPFIGGTLYLFLGETRLGPHRVQRHKEIVSLFRNAPTHMPHHNPTPQSTPGQSDESDSDRISADRRSTTPDSSSFSHHSERSEESQLSVNATPSLLLSPSPGTPGEGRGEGSAQGPVPLPTTSLSPIPSSAPSTQHSSCPNLSSRYEPMVLQAERISGLPVLPDNRLHFLTTADSFTRHLAADIDSAQSHVHLLYYIFSCDNTARTVTDALKRAVARGVTCRLLVDAVASRLFFHRRHGLARELRAAGIHVAAALPAHFIQRRLPRMDLRNHRKLAVIDDSIGYVGSHNLIHPDYNGKRGGPWVDTSARLTGPIVAELAALFAEDWAFETEQLLEVRPSPAPPLSPSPGTPGEGRGEGSVPHPTVNPNASSSARAAGIPPASSSPSSIPQSSMTPMQLVPTGPTESGATYRRVLLAAIQCARTRLTLTTPYFVPDEPTLVSLAMAADRGVTVTLILPAVSDNRFTQAAGRAHFDRLLAAGVRIFLYRPGLLHTKSVTVDDTLAVFGSANLDVRSFNLNFEVSLLLYSRDATERLRAIQATYLADSSPLDPATWSARPPLRRYTDSAISLLSPLL